MNEQQLRDKIKTTEQEMEALLDWIMCVRKPDMNEFKEKCAAYRNKKTELQQLELQLLEMQ